MSEYKDNRLERCFERISKFDPRPEVVAHDLQRTRQCLTKLIDSQAQVNDKTWKAVTRRRLTKLVAAAVLAVVSIVGIVKLGETVDEASVVFAAAMDSVRQARTFSYTEINVRPNRDGDASEGETFLFQNTWMFKEPDWQRHERPKGPWGKVANEVTVTHYGKRQRLELNGVAKTARLHDLSSSYEVDNKTGELRLTRLHTDMRDHLLKTSAGAVDDLGEGVLEGNSVRILQSRKGQRVTTVWIDPETGHPVQIEHKWPGQDRSPLLYTAIQIDTELDDALFSLEPPAGYAAKATKALYPDERMKMVAKIMHLGARCLSYRSRGKYVYPNELADLVTAGIMSADALKTVLAAPDAPDGPPVIRYRRPNDDAPDPMIEVMLYEAFEEGSGDGRVMVYMLFPCASLMPVQTVKQYLKPWPERQKKLSANMAWLHWFCDRYAKEHGGRYPAKLADLVGSGVSEGRIRWLQAPEDQPDLPPVIRYHPPRTNAEPSSEVIFTEIFDQWPDDGAVVCYADGRCELVSDPIRFEALLR